MSARCGRVRTGSRLAVAVVVLIVGACSSGQDGSLEPAEDDLVLDRVAVDGAVGDEPRVDFEAPLETGTTVRRVLVEGDGEVVGPDTEVLLDYVSYNGRDGSLYDSSFDPRQALDLVATPEGLRPGMARGIIGVPVGSRVLVAVSPDDGPEGGDPEEGLGADDTLVEVIDIRPPRIAVERSEGTPVEPRGGLPEVTLDEGGAPAIALPGTEPPDDLVVQPLIVGEGAEVRTREMVTLHVEGVVWRTGEVFHSTWRDGEPDQFKLGVGSHIPAWDEALIGATVGSQLLLVVPPGLGYRDAVAELGIRRDDTLVYVVDILRSERNVSPAEESLRPG